MNNISLIYNDLNNGIKVLNTIEEQLRFCNEFLISVAFITNSGVSCLLESLKNLNNKGIKGKILTSDYLYFSDPSALKKLNSYDNIDIRIFKCDNIGFHTKGYIFKQDDFDIILVGSSNLTQAALSTNKEWNSKMSLTHGQDYLNQLYNEFYSMWNVSASYTDYIEDYTYNYNIKKSYDKRSSIPGKQSIIPKPNLMQTKFINNFSRSYNNNEKLGLLVSATGSGKTYASAFAIKHIGFKKVLFVCHRTSILKQAIASYSIIFEDFKYGLIDSNNKDFNEDFIFANIMTISKDENLSNFDKSYFDLIIYDEVHRAGSSSYKKLTEYFSPKYLLGMSATPTRGDNFDIYGMFNNNILYEITLQQALKYNLLCPFHYFGISDLILNNNFIDDKSSFNLLTSDARVNHIIDSIKSYTIPDIKPIGLIFCRSIMEADDLSIKLNNNGLKTVSLNSKNSNVTTINNCINLLKSSDSSDYLDYIITVDLFNEGIDIPEINQIIMLRPTLSPIVFTQQLGRGLRKSNGKHYVIILDFIGNYDNNYMIPISLSNDFSYNKDSIRKFITNPNGVLEGESTIHFDTITRSQIFKSIDSNRFNSVKFIKDIYKSTYTKLGKIPTLLEFYKHSNYDPCLIFKNKSFLSYYGLLINVEPNITKLSNVYQIHCLNYISSIICNGKRLHEVLILEYLISNNSISTSNIINLFNNHSLKYNANTINNIINVLNSDFITGTMIYSKKKAKLISFTNNIVSLSTEFMSILDSYFLSYITDTLDFAKNKYFKEYYNTYSDTNFVIGKKYTYFDVCRLLDWHRSVNASSIGGYFYDKITNTCPVFINYQKNMSIKESINYNDRFIDNSTLIATSKNNRSINSKEIINIYNPKTKKHLFIRKNKDDKESNEFYYLGYINTIGSPKQIYRNNHKEVEISYKLDTAVSNDIYEYITNSSIE